MYNKIFKQYEEGDGGITYAMCFIAIIFSVTLFSYFQFNTNAYVLKEKLETALHVAESAVLTANQGNVNDTGIREDEFDREAYRYHIVTAYDATINTKMEKEEKQLKFLASTMVNSLTNGLGLDTDNYTVKNGFLQDMCGTDGFIAIKNMTIYEPVYEIRTTQSGSNLTGDLKFTTTYTPIKWIKYVIYFKDGSNIYNNSTKEILEEAPILYNGKSAKGATLQVTLGTSFKGLKNIFAKVGSNSTSIFSQDPEEGRITYSVNVTLAMDIVLADNDDRNITKK